MTDRVVSVARPGRERIRRIVGADRARWRRFRHRPAAGSGAARFGAPGIDGLTVCRQIHDIEPTLDVVMLTARDEELDVVVGLDVGAIDPITKPFKLAELLARIRAQLRRRETRPDSRSAVGDLVMDGGACRVWLAGREVQLRAKELDLLSRLVENAGMAVPRETLISDVWDEHWFGSTKTLACQTPLACDRITRPPSLSPHPQNPNASKMPSSTISTHSSCSSAVYRSWLAPSVSPM